MQVGGVRRVGGSGIEDHREELLGGVGGTRPEVVPSHDPLRLGEDLLRGEPGAEFGLDVGHHDVVETQHREVQLGEDQVLVVTWVADQGDLL